MGYLPFTTQNLNILTSSPAPQVRILIFKKTKNRLPGDFLFFGRDDNVRLSPLSGFALLRRCRIFLQIGCRLFGKIRRFLHLLRRSESSFSKKQKIAFPAIFCFLVGMTGFEPAAFASRTQRSTKLSHIPLFITLYIIILYFIFSSTFCNYSEPFSR